MASNSTDINNSLVGAVIQDVQNVCIGNINVNAAESIPSNDFILPPLIRTFTGRDKELTHLASLFFNEDKKNIKNKVVICGFGGIGKSEFAKQFATKCLKDGKIQDTYWINSETEIELKKSAKKIKKVYERMKGKKCLFILDNGISRKMLSECEFELPDDFFFIITSQEKQWGIDIESFPLNSIDLELAVDFYKTYLNLENDFKVESELFIKLAEFVGCIPLGLQITAAYAHQAKGIYGENYLQEYVKELEESQKKFIQINFPSSADNSYNKSIYKAIILSLNKVVINKNCEYPDFALCAVYICSYIDPERIKFRHLLDALNTVEQLDKNILKKVLYTLDNLSLVSYYPNKKRIKMHRFIQEVLRYNLKINDHLIQTKCYTACLKVALELDYWQFKSVLQYADENLTIFKAYYESHKTIFEKYSNKVLQLCTNLVEYECVKSLKLILDDVLDQSDESHRFIVSLYSYVFFKFNNLESISSYVKIISKDCHCKKYNTLLLFAAASVENVSAKKFLLEHGADKRIIDEQGNPPLFVFKGLPYDYDLMQGW